MFRVQKKKKVDGLGEKRAGFNKAGSGTYLFIREFSFSYNGLGFFMIIMLQYANPSTPVRNSFTGLCTQCAETWNSN